MHEFTGREYLKIDIANSYGLDKKDWSERLAWFDAHENQLEELVIQAKEPAMFYAGVKAWRDVQAGRPIGYTVGLDATSSGLQILAALTGDRSAAELCNVVNTGHRRDAYKSIYERMTTIITDSTKIDRDKVKDAIMTAFYGSKAVPKQVFGTGKLLDIFYEVMATLAPAAWELNEAFLAMWDPDATINSWVLPDNFHVHVKVMDTVREVVHFQNKPYDVYHKVNRPMAEGRSLGANTIHSVDGMIVRELTRRCDHDPVRINQLREWIHKGSYWGAQAETDNDKMVIKLWGHYERTGYLSARILDHLNPSNGGYIDINIIEELLNSLPEKPFKVVSVHDRFACLPHYANDLRRQYNHQLMLLARSNLLQDLISQILGRFINVGKLDPSLWRDISTADYALS